jgi:hypothetical protein
MEIKMWELACLRKRQVSHRNYWLTRRYRNDEASWKKT